MSFRRFKETNLDFPVCSPGKNCGPATLLHTIILCDMSPGFSPSLARFCRHRFAMDVISVGIRRYSVLVSCVTAAMIVQLVPQAFQMPPETFLISGLPIMTVAIFFMLAVFAAAAGLGSILFCTVLLQANHLCERFFNTPLYLHPCGRQLSALRLQQPLQHPEDRLVHNPGQPVPRRHLSGITDNVLIKARLPKTSVPLGLFALSSPAHGHRHRSAVPQTSPGIRHPPP